MSAKKSDDGAVHPFIWQQFSLTVLGYLRVEQKRSLLDIPENLQKLILKFYVFIHQPRSPSLASHQPRINQTLAKSNSDYKKRCKKYQDSVLQLVQQNSPGKLFVTVGARTVTCCRFGPGVSGATCSLYTWYFQVPHDVKILHFHVIGLGNRDAGSYKYASKSETKPARFPGKITYCTSATNANWNCIRFVLQVSERRLFIEYRKGTVVSQPSNTITFDVDTNHDGTHSYGIDILLKGSQASYIVADFAMSIESSE